MPVLHGRRGLIGHKGQTDALGAGGKAQAFSTLDVEWLERYRVVRAAHENGAAPRRRPSAKPPAPHNRRSAPRSERVGLRDDAPNQIARPVHADIRADLGQFADVMLGSAARYFVFVNAVQR